MTPLFLCPSPLLQAKKYISDAIREFEGTSEEVSGVIAPLPPTTLTAPTTPSSHPQVRVTVADSELAIARGDVEGALKKLRKIPKESPHYTKVGGWRLAVGQPRGKRRQSSARECTYEERLHFLA